MAEPRKRVIVFIDGNNLYHRLKENDWKTSLKIWDHSQSAWPVTENLSKYITTTHHHSGGKGHTLNEQ